MTQIVIVDENDSPIGFKERTDVIPSDIYRVSAIWVTNTRGEILLAQRAHTKAHSPGKWGTAVAGTVDKGEEYLDNALKEAQEELGLSLDAEDLKQGPKHRVASGHSFFCQWYFLERDIDLSVLKLQEDEVDAVRWIAPQNLLIELRERPDTFVSSNPKAIEELIRVGAMIHASTTPSA